MVSVGIVQWLRVYGVFGDYACRLVQLHLVFAFWVYGLSFSVGLNLVVSCLWSLGRLKIADSSVWV